MTNPRNACKPTRPMCERWPVHYDLESPEARAEREAYIKCLTPKQRQERLERAIGAYRGTAKE